MSETRAMAFGLVARRWIRDQLVADPVLAGLGITGVYKAGNVGDATYPFIVMDVASRFTANLNGEARTTSGTGRVIVRAIYKTTSDDVVEPAAERIIELLEHRIQEPVDGGGLILVCHYDGDVEMPILDDDEQYRSLGATFRMQIQAT